MVENSRRFGGAATRKFRGARNWAHGAVLGTLAAQLSQWPRKRMQPISFRHPAIEWLWALAVHQMRLGFALWLLAKCNLAWRRTQHKRCRNPASEWLLGARSTLVCAVRMLQRASLGRLQKVSGGKLVPTTNCRPTMRHSAVSRYHWLSGRMSAEFNVIRQCNDIGTSLPPRDICTSWVGRD